MDYQDEVIACVGCGAEFTFTASAHKFYFDTMGWISKPKRCAPCRKEANKVRLATRITERGERIENRALLSGEMQTRGQHGDD